MLFKSHCLHFGGLQALALVGCLSVSAGVATATCPGSLNNAQWRWDAIEWTYSGSASTTGISNAAGDWNSAQSQITISTSQGYEDIAISDNNNMSNLGQTTLYSQQYDPACYLKQDNTYGYCYNSSMMYYITIELNQNLVATTASQWSLTNDQVIEKTMVHELGHGFNLANDDTAYDCSSPTIMNTQGGPYFCGFYTPQTCDTNEFNALYSGWSVFPYTGGCNTSLTCS